MAFLRWAPELILGSAAFPSLQVSAPPLRHATPRACMECSAGGMLASMLAKDAFLRDGMLTIRLLLRQFPILLSSSAILVAAAVEVAVCSAAAAYLGFLYGSSMGARDLPSPCVSPDGHEGALQHAGLCSMRACYCSACPRDNLPGVTVPPSLFCCLVPSV